MWEGGKSIAALVEWVLGGLRGLTGQKWQHVGGGTAFLSGSCWHTIPFTHACSIVYFECLLASRGCYIQYTSMYMYIYSFLTARLIGSVAGFLKITNSYL